MADLIERWPLYRSIRSVRANRIARIVEEGRMLVFEDGSTMQPTGDFLKKRSPAEGDYVLIYEDGYTTICPAGIFIRGFVRA